VQFKHGSKIQTKPYKLQFNITRLLQHISTKNSARLKKKNTISETVGLDRSCQWIIENIKTVWLS